MNALSVFYSAVSYGLMREHSRLAWSSDNRSSIHQCIFAYIRKSVRNAGWDEYEAIVTIDS